MRQIQASSKYLRKLIARYDDFKFPSTFLLRTEQCSNPFLHILLLREIICVCVCEILRN